MDEDAELERLAVEALMKDAKRGKERAETLGPSGWRKEKIPTTNKRFLQRTLLGAVASHKRKEKEQDQVSSKNRKYRKVTVNEKPRNSTHSSKTSKQHNSKCGKEKKKESTSETSEKQFHERVPTPRKRSLLKKDRHK